MTTGTHGQQNCLFLLTESRHSPGRLVQSSPRGGSPGTYSLIHLDLPRYDQLARRFAEEQAEGTDFLTSGIQTRNANFNALIDRMERVPVRSQAPILQMGPVPPAWESRIWRAESGISNAIGGRFRAALWK